MQALTKQIIYTLTRKSRQATFHKQPYYAAIPYYYKPNFIDMHDTYTKRSMEQIKAALKDKQWDIQYQRRLYCPGDYHITQKQQKAVAVLDYQQFNFSQLQFDRFKNLVGQRLKKDTTRVKFACHMYPTYQANFEKLNEQIYEVLIQTFRAP